MYVYMYSLMFNPVWQEWYAKFEILTFTLRCVCVQFHAYSIVHQAQIAHMYNVERIHRLVKGLTVPYT